MYQIKTVGTNSSFWKPALPLLVGGGILLSSWVFINYLRHRRLLYLGEFYKKKGPDIWEQWGSLDADAILGVYNIAENILRQIRKGIKRSSGITSRDLRTEKINDELQKQDWVFLLRKTIPEEYIKTLPKNFTVKIECDTKTSRPYGKVLTVVYDETKPNQINSMGISICYVGSYSKRVSLKHLRLMYLPLIIHELMLALQYVRFGSTFKKEKQKISRSIYERFIREFQRTGSIERASKLKDVYIKSLPWQLEAQAVSAGAARAILSKSRGKQPVLQVRFIKDIIKDATKNAYDNMNILAEFGLDPMEAENVFLELSKNAEKAILYGISGKKEPMGFVRIQ